MIPLRTAKRDLGFGKTLALRRPFDVLVQVTNRCNMKCSFCDFWPNGVPAKDELTVSDYERLSNELAQLGTVLVSIEGGEPFIRPDLIEIIRVFAKHHLPILYTNGWFIDAEKAKALYDAGVSQVGVSIDFPDADRHDAKRRLKHAYEHACRAIEHLREAAPNGGKQVHVMSVLMRDNQDDVEALLQLSERLGVGHMFTLISTTGYRRGQGVDAPPDKPMSPVLAELRRKYEHFRAFRDYLAQIDPFLAGGDMPTCRAGEQSFNIDHLGNVAPCIEKIDRPVGNVREASLPALHALVKKAEGVSTCQDCWTLCRGTSQALGNGGSVRGWTDMLSRMRTSG